jgi:hypothetical protein
MLVRCHWCSYCLWRSAVFLGTGGLSTGSGGWIQLGELSSFLERSRHRYAALFDSSFIAGGLIAIFHRYYDAVVSPSVTKLWWKTRPAKPKNVVPMKAVA